MMKQLLALPSPSSSQLSSPSTVHTIPGLCGNHQDGHNKVKYSPVELLRAALPHFTAQDRTDVLTALGITIDEAAGEVLIQTSNGQKRLLLGDPTP